MLGRSFVSCRNAISTAAFDRVESISFLLPAWLQPLTFHDAILIISGITEATPDGPGCGVRYRIFPWLTCASTWILLMSVLKDAMEYLS